MNRKISGLYAVTPDQTSTELLLEKVRLAISGGASAVQYRNKRAPAPLQLRQAEALASLTRTSGALFIVNDSIELARAVDADGVHLGRDDGDIASARAQLPDKIIGISCYNELQRAELAARQGADYVAFGAAFPSSTKPNGTRAPLALYRQAAGRLAIPVVAIGGIDAHNARELVDAGVAAVAVISALFDAEDVAAAAREISSPFRKQAMKEKS
jgi:thiamine-phosphate pyrophosphorylase